MKRIFLVPKIKNSEFLNRCGAGGGIRTHAARKGHGLSCDLLKLQARALTGIEPVVHLATPAPMIIFV